jgi:hypothetical protein
LIVAFILAFGLATQVNAQTGAKPSPPLTAEEAAERLRQIADASEKANPPPTYPGWLAEQRGAYGEAATLYRKACYETRYALACYALAKLYEKGKGVPQDWNQAIALYQRALILEPGNKPLYERSIDEARSAAGGKPREWQHLVACFRSRALISNIVHDRLEESGKNTEEARSLWHRAYSYRLAAIALLADEGLWGQELIDQVNGQPFGKSEYTGYYDPNEIDKVCIDPSEELVNEGYDIQEEIVYGFE